MNIPPRYTPNGRTDIITARTINITNTKLFYFPRDPMYHLIHPPGTMQPPRRREGDKRRNQTPHKTDRQRGRGRGRTGGTPRGKGTRWLEHESYTGLAGSLALPLPLLPLSPRLPPFANVPLSTNPTSSPESCVKPETSLSIDEERPLLKPGGGRTAGGGGPHDAPDTGGMPSQRGGP